jgi:hypothetical protein
MERLRIELLAAEAKCEALKKEIHRNLTQMTEDVADASIPARRKSSNPRKPS